MAVHRTAGLATQLADVGQMLALGQAPMMTALQQGPQIFSMYGNSLSGLGQAFKDVGGLALGFARTLMGPLGLAVGAVAGLMAGLTSEINSTAEVQVGFFDVALAGWQLLAESIGSLLSPVFGWIADRFSQLWDWLSPILKGIGNTIIGTFVGAFDAVKIAWGALPNVLGEIAYNAANNVVNGVEFLVDEATKRINDLIALANKIPGVNIDPLTTGGADLGGEENPYAGAMTGLGSDVMGAFEKGFSVDYMGNAFGALSGRAQEIAAARAEVEELDGAAKKANSSANALGATLSEAARAAKAEWDFYRGTFNGFFSDLSQGLKDGEGFWQSFGNAASNALNSIAERLMGMASNGLFDMLFGAFGNSLGGGWGVQGGFNGFAGTFGIPGMATGGTVAGAGLSWVGERGPELMRLPRGAQIIPNNQSMAMAANQNQANDNSGSVTVRLIMPEGWQAEVLEQAGANAIKIVQANQKANTNYKMNGGN
jgi:hypothetical protein